MQKYNVEVVETLSRVVEVEANNYEEAEDLITEKYNNSDIVLDYNDLESTNYKPYPSEKFKDNISLQIDYDKSEETLIIGSENTTGAKYKCRNREDLELSIKSYIDNYIDFDKIDPRKNKDNRER